MPSVSAREARQQFARLLGEASAGQEIVITRRGKLVAVLSRYRPSVMTLERQAAIERIRAAMKHGIGTGARRFTRDEMHER